MNKKFLFVLSFAAPLFASQSTQELEKPVISTQAKYMGAIAASSLALGALTHNSLLTGIGIGTATGMLCEELKESWVYEIIARNLLCIAAGMPCTIETEAKREVWAPGVPQRGRINQEVIQSKGHNAVGLMISAWISSWATYFVYHHLEKKNRKPKNA